MASNIFVNLPVKDLDRSKAFFEALGYTFNPMFTDEKAGCLVIGDNIFAMLLTEEFFRTFTHREIADTTRQVEVLVALSAESREEVDRLVDTALAHGATSEREPQDHGFMYERSFVDPDGHTWEYLWMDMAAAEAQMAAQASANA